MIIATLLVIYGLEASYSVTMPLAVAVVIIAAAWPVKPWLDRFLPSSLSYAGTILVLLLVCGAFVGAVYFSIAHAVQAFSQNQDEFSRMYENVRHWAEQRGLRLGGQGGFSRMIAIGQALLSNAYTLLGYLGFIAILIVLGLPEVPHMRRKMQNEFDASERREWLRIADEIAEKIRQYLGVTLATSVLTGVACAVWSFVIGLDLALVWGILNFILNFVPVVGNIVGIFPPSLYAIIQFKSLTWPIIAFVGFAVIQIVISNFVYPMLQGRSLALSPVVVVLALAFWGWIWGIAGALIAIPLTVMLVIICDQFERTRWISKLLSSPQEP